MAQRCMGRVRLPAELEPGLEVTESSNDFKGLIQVVRERLVGSRKFLGEIRTSHQGRERGI